MNRTLQLALLAAVSVTVMAGAAHAETPESSEGASALVLKKPSVDAGGGSASSPSFRLSGTVAQPDVGDSASASFGFRGGRWPGASGATGAEVFSDGFESGDTGSWSGSTGGPAAN